MRNQVDFDRAMQMDRPVLLTPRQTANTGIMSLYAIRRGIVEGTIPYVKIGSHYRINYTQLLRQVNGEEVQKQK